MPSRLQTAGGVEEHLQQWGAHPAGPSVLFALAIVEATLFPAPTEAVLVALVLAHPPRARRWMVIATSGSVIGGVIGYTVGAAVSVAWAGPVLEWTGSSRWVGEVGELYRQGYAVALATSGFTPVPYLAYTAAAGAAGVPLPAFIGFSLLGRGLKYSVVGVLALLLGPAVRRVLARTGPGVAFAALAALLIVYLLSRS